MTDKPSLIVRVVDAPGAPGGKVVALCTEDGQPFGLQLACSVSSEPDDFTRVTVVLAVDGSAVRLAE